MSVSLGRNQTIFARIIIKVICLPMTTQLRLFSPLQHGIAPLSITPQNYTTPDQADPVPEATHTDTFFSSQWNRNKPALHTITLHPTAQSATTVHFPTPNSKALT